MTRDEIIEGILKDLRIQANVSETSFGNERDNENEIKEIIEALESSLKSVEADASVRTCEDFGYSNVECCETCHHLDPHYEMSLIDLESGGKAWICCAMDRALNPEKLKRLEQSPEYRQIVSMLGSDAPIAPELIASYRATEYRVTASRPFTLLIGKRSEPLAGLMAEHGLKSAAYITAYNRHSQRRSEDENRSAQDSLRRYLGNRAVAFFDAEGADPSGTWRGEHGFLVLGLELEDAKGAGVFFGQNAIVWVGEDAVPQLVILVDDGR